jgi:hypothetical protein
MPRHLAAHSQLIDSQQLCQGVGKISWGDEGPHHEEREYHCAAKDAAAKHSTVAQGMRKRRHERYERTRHVCPGLKHDQGERCHYHAAHQITSTMEAQQFESSSQQHTSLRLTELRRPDS